MDRIGPEKGNPLIDEAQGNIQSLPCSQMTGGDSASERSDNDYR